MHKHQSPKRVRYALALGAVLLFASLLAACSAPVFSAVDGYTCIIDKDTGKIIKELPPGSPSENAANKNWIIYVIPQNDRFYFASSQRDLADDGAPAYYTGRSQGNGGGKIMYIEAKTRMKFKANTACSGWLLQHGTRNDVSPRDGDLQFNARLPQGDANEVNPDGSAKRAARTEWAKWLNENFGPNMQRVVNEVTSEYSWEHMYYDLPVNSGSDGVAKPDDKASERTRQAMEKNISALFTKELSEKIGGQYFCGIGYDPAKPDVCPDITIEITRVDTPDKDAIKAREDLDKQRDQAKNLTEQNKISEDLYQQKLAAQDNDKKIRDLETKIANEKEGDARTQLLEKLETAKIQAQIDAQKCIVLKEQAGYTCAEEEAAKHQQGNTNVQVNPPSTEPGK